MNYSIDSFAARFRRDRIFWIIIAALGAAYVLFVAQIGMQVVATILGLLIAITVHEFSHAWAADRLGDPTARFLGRVSLNPLVHLDPLGTVMMVVTAITGMGIGWGKPVPVTTNRLRYGSRRGHALVSLAGPASNLLVAIVLGLSLRAGLSLWPDALLSIHLAGIMLADVIWIIALTNIIIAMFNLIPIPPLDGHSVLIGLLSLSRSQLAWRLTGLVEGLARLGPMLLLGIIILSQFAGLNLLGALIIPPTRWLSRIILGF